MRVYFFVLILLLGCGQTRESALSEKSLSMGRRVAWVGASQGDLRIMVEKLDSSFQSHSDYREGKLLKGFFRLGPNQSLYRLHLVGDSSLLAESGRLLADGVTYWNSFGLPPEELNPRERLFWVGLGQGGVLPQISGATRRNFLFAGDASSSDTPVSLRWELGEEKVLLRSRRWTASDRRRFLNISPSPLSP